MVEPVDIPPVVPSGATFEFGQSPFRVKGVLYEGTQTFFEKNVPGGFARLVETIGPGPLADFINRDFIASSWYDVLPAPALIVYEAKAMDLPVDAYLHKRTQWQVEQDTGGVYRVLLKVVSARKVSDRLPILVSQMFDFCELEVERPADKERIAHFGGVPETLEAWFRVSLRLYTEHVLTRAGAQAVDFQFLDTEPEPPREGVARVRLGFSVTFE